MKNESDFRSDNVSDVHSFEPHEFEECETTLEILEYFSHQPTFGDFCQKLVLEIFADFQPWGACVGSFHSDGHVKVLGAFGMGDGLLLQYEHASCLGMPTIGGLYVNGLRASDPEDLPSVGGVGLFPLLNSHGPNAIGLIKNSTGFSGFIQVLFLHPVDPAVIASKFDVLIRVLGILLPIYRTSWQSTQSFVSDGDLLNTGEIRRVLEGHEEAPSLDHKLTVRQEDILKKISLGKTNAQIARDIGFSESTVRQETIDIYRKLGVNDRKNAVTVAQSRGLIPQLQDIGVEPTRHFAEML